MAYAPVDNHGIVGDLHTAALVGIDGCIDFMCFPCFDSRSIFAALLDAEKGGRFKIAPAMERVRHKQIYIPDSAILITGFLSDEGVAEISDFMPIKDLGHEHDLVRRAKSVRGDLRFQMVLVPRFDYGRANHRVESRKHETLFISEGRDGTVLRLRTEAPVRIEKGAAVAEFNLRSGETRAFILEDASDGVRSPSAFIATLTRTFGTKSSARLFNTKAHELSMLGRC